MVTSLMAREKFRSLVKTNGGSKKVANLLGCSRAYVDMIIGGSRGPNMTTSYRIEQLLGMKMVEWCTEVTVGGPTETDSQEGR